MASFVRHGWNARALMLVLALGADPPLPAAAQDAFSLEDISFLVGCWAGQTGDLDMRETWTSAEGGMMLGTTRYVRDGRVIDFEFARISENPAGITLWPYPQGEVSEDGFPLVRVAPEYVFENLEHDFPVRIIYVRDGNDTLHPRIEGTDGRGPGWFLERVPCADGG